MRTIIKILFAPILTLSKFAFWGAVLILLAIWYFFGASPVDIVAGLGFLF